MKYLRIILSTLLILFAAEKLLCQTVLVKGRLVYSATLEPVAAAKVFINRSTLITTTNKNGEFILNNIEPAVYELIFFQKGYEKKQLKISLNSELNLGDIKLKKTNPSNNPSSKNVSRDAQWEKNFKKFKKHFLGEDKIADQCSVLNPKAISFFTTEKDKTVNAFASEPIETVNWASGYSIHFYMDSPQAISNTEFISGSYYFADDLDVSDKWMFRKELYAQSVQHLFKSIIDNRISGEGFSVLNPLSKKVYDTTSLVTRTPQNGIFKISFKDSIEIRFRKSTKKAPTKLYQLRLKKDFVFANQNGLIINESDLIISSTFNQRLAQFLPINFNLPDTQSKPSTVDEENLLSQLWENIYIHTDKPYYYPGEPLWFKGYISYSRPSLRDSLSKTVYVELIDTEKKTVELSHVLKIDSGFFYGDFVLPDTLKASVYQLRAYTSLARNFGEEKLYSKPIPVLNILDKADPLQSNYQPMPIEQLTILPNKAEYKTREKIMLAIQAFEEGKPIEAHLSVSITDAEQVVPIENQIGIAQSFQLNRIADATGKHFNHPVEFGLSFSGQFLNDLNKPEKITLNFIRFNPRSITFAQADENGKFQLDGLRFYDTATFSIQTSKSTIQRYGNVNLLARQTVAINYIRSENSIRLLKTESAQRVISEFEVPKDNRLLKEMTVRGKRIKMQQSENYIKRPFYHGGDRVLTAEQLGLQKGYSNILYYIAGKVPGLIVNIDPPSVRFSRASGLSVNNSQGPLILLNDVPFVGDLTTIDPNTVESIEFTARIRVMYGAQGAGGIIAIYTKGGGFLEPVAANYQKLTLDGYYSPRKFKFPKYDDPKTDSTSADYRSLLYWNPSLHTTSRATELSFFASDLPGRYHIEIEGVSKTGKPIHTDYYLKVESR